MPIDLSTRFRGFYPVVVDVETAGLEPSTDALLELAVVPIITNESGKLIPAEAKNYHIQPFLNANIDENSLEVTKIQPFHPFRVAIAIDESEAIKQAFAYVKSMQKEYKCQRSILVGHNAWFDLSFLNAAVKRNKIKKSPFHMFSSIDTVSLGAIAYKHTVLAKIIKLAGIEFDCNKAHSALYDAQKTAELFCKIINDYDKNNNLL